jgi:hypothetical protein
MIWEKDFSWLYQGFPIFVNDLAIAHHQLRRKMIWAGNEEKIRPFPGRKRPDEMVKVKMFCNIDGHHLIGEFRSNPHLQSTPERSIQITLGEKSFRIDPVCYQSESSEINLLLENSLDSLQFLSDPPS